MKLKINSFKKFGIERKERWQYQKENVGLKKIVIFKTGETLTCWLTSL